MPVTKDQVKAACDRLQKEFSDPGVQAGIAQVLAHHCTYPVCKCIVGTSTLQPESVCRLGLEKLKTGDRVHADGDLRSTGTVIEIEAKRGAFVRWHKGYAAWIKPERLSRA